MSAGYFNEFQVKSCIGFERVLKLFLKAVEFWSPFKALKFFFIHSTRWPLKVL